MIEKLFPRILARDDNAEILIDYYKKINEIIEAVNGLYSYLTGSGRPKDHLNKQEPEEKT